MSFGRCRVPWSCAVMRWTFPLAGKVSTFVARVMRAHESRLVVACWRLRCRLQPVSAAVAADAPFLRRIWCRYAIDGNAAGRVAVVGRGEAGRGCGCTDAARIEEALAGLVSPATMRRRYASACNWWTTRRWARGLSTGGGRRLQLGARPTSACMRCKACGSCCRRRRSPSTGCLHRHRRCWPMLARLSLDVPQLPVGRLPERPSTVAFFVEPAAPALTDDLGWRIEIKRYPKLTEIGASAVEGGAAAGTQDELKHSLHTRRRAASPSCRRSTCRGTHERRWCRTTTGLR